MSLFKKIFALCLLPYAFWLVFAYVFHFIDWVNLFIDEGGHFLCGFLLGLDREVPLFGAAAGGRDLADAMVVHIRDLNIAGRVHGKTQENPLEEDPRCGSPGSAVCDGSPEKAAKEGECPGRSDREVADHC